MLSRIISYPIKGPSKGYIKNYSPTLLDDRLLILEGGLNMRNRLGGVEVVPGWAKYATTALTGVPLTLAIYKKPDGTKKLMALTHQKAYVWNPNTVTFDNVTRQTSSVDVDYTGAGTTPWSVTVAQGLFVATNGTDNIQKWDGTGKFVDLGGTPPKAKVLCPFFGYLLAGNVVEGTNLYPTRFWYSVQNSIENWQVANGAGFYELNDTPGGIVAIEPIQRAVIIYKEDAWYLCEYTSEPAFPFNVKLGGIGGSPISHRAIANIYGEHIYLGRDNVYRNNGILSVPIGDAVAKEIFSSINPITANMSFAVLDKKHSDVYFVVPTGASNYPDKAYVYNYADNIWSPPIDFAATCWGEWEKKGLTIDELTGPIDSYTMAIDSLGSSGTPTFLVGTSDGYIHEMNDSLTQKDGVSYTTYVETKRVSFGDSTIKKRLLRVKVEVENIPLAGLDVYIGKTDDPDGQIVWHKVGTITEGGDPWVDCDLTARFFALRAMSESTDTLWKFNGWTPEFYALSER